MKKPINDFWVLSFGYLIIIIITLISESEFKIPLISAFGIYTCMLLLLFMVKEEFNKRKDQ